MAGDVAQGVTMLRLRAEHARADEAIRRLAQFPEQNPNPVLRATADGSLLFANAAAQAWLAALGATESAAAAGASATSSAPGVDSGKGSIEGAAGARDSVSLATGFIAPLWVGSGIRATTLTATEPMPPPFTSPKTARGRWP